MRLSSFGLLLGSARCRLAAAQVLPTPQDIVATHYHLLGAECALFPATAKLPDWLPAKNLAAQRRFTPAASQVAAAGKALAAVQLLRVNPGAKTRQDPTYARNITQRLGHYQQYFGFYNRRKQPCVCSNFLRDFPFTPEEADGRPTPPGYIPYWLQRYV